MFFLINLFKNFLDKDINSVLVVMLSLYMSIMIFALILLIIFFGLYSYGLFKLGKNNGCEEIALIGFIPVLRIYLVAKLGGDFYLFGKYKIESEKFGIIAIILLMLTSFSTLCNIIAVFVEFYLFRNLYSKLKFNNKNLWAIVSLFFPLIFYICIFIKRNAVFDDDDDDYTNFSDDYIIMD